MLALGRVYATTPWPQHRAGWIAPTSFTGVFDVKHARAVEPLLATAENGDSVVFYPSRRAMLRLQGDGPCVAELHADLPDGNILHLWCDERGAVRKMFVSAGGNHALVGCKLGCITSVYFTEEPFISPYSCFKLHARAPTLDSVFALLPCDSELLTHFRSASA